MKTQQLTTTVAMALIAMTLTFTVAATEFANITLPARGDLDGNEAITMDDVAALGDILANRTEQAPLDDTADYNGSGDVTVLDLLLMYQDVLAAPAGGIPAPLETHEGGDLNGDGVITSGDIELLHVYLTTGLEPFRLAVADVNQDGTVDMQDLVKMTEAAVTP